MKFFEILFKIIVTILITLSTLAIVAIHYIGYRQGLYLHISGIENYLDLYGKFSSLFAGAIATLSLLFALLRLKEAAITNREKLKQDQFNEWKLTLEIRAEEVADKNSILKREVIKERLKMYNILHDYGFKIDNKKQLTEVFDVLKDRVATFESSHARTVQLGEIYPDDKTAYSLQDFIYVFFGGIDQYYNKAFEDLTELYLNNISKNRIINSSLYKSSLNI